MKNILTILLSLLVSNSAIADQPKPWQFGFQEAATEIMHQITWLHDLLLVIIAAIVVIVFGLLAFVCIRFNSKNNPIPATFSHNVVIEIIWTVIPTIILFIIAIPSFQILHKVEHSPKFDFTIKVVAAQWYWNYEYPTEGIKYDSYMVEEKDLKDGQLRLLDVDNPLVVPQGATVKFLITSQDVIHSFAIPSAGIKTDAIPGKTNEAHIKIDRLGTYYGQCSELCGIHHAFMPIMLKIVTKEEYAYWLEQTKKQFSS